MSEHSLRLWNAGPLPRLQWGQIPCTVTCFARHSGRLVHVSLSMRLHLSPVGAEPGLKTMFLDSTSHSLDKHVNAQSSESRWDATQEQQRHLWSLCAEWGLCRHDTIYYSILQSKCPAVWKPLTSQVVSHTSQILCALQRPMEGRCSRTDFDYGL